MNSRLTTQIAFKLQYRKKRNHEIWLQLIVSKKSFKKLTVMTIKMFVVLLCKVKKFKSLINEDKMILLKFL